MARSFRVCPDCLQGKEHVLVVRLRKTLADCKLNYLRSTLCVFETVDYSFRDEDFFNFVSGLALYLHHEFLLAFDDFSIFAVPHELEVNLGLEAGNVNLPLRGLR